MNPFAIVCQKQENVKPQNPKKGTLNTVNEEPHPKDSVNFLQSAIRYESDNSSGEDNTVALIKNDNEKKNFLTCTSKLVPLQLHSSWNPGALVLFSIGFSDCT